MSFLHYFSIHQQLSLLYTQPGLWITWAAHQSRRLTFDLDSRSWPRLLLRHHKHKGGRDRRAPTGETHPTCVLSGRTSSTRQPADSPFHCLSVKQRRLPWVSLFGKWAEVDKVSSPGVPLLHCPHWTHTHTHSQCNKQGIWWRMTHLCLYITAPWCHGGATYGDKMPFSPAGSSICVSALIRCNWGYLGKAAAALTQISTPDNQRARWSYL